MMIADSCEAAARSLAEPTPDNIRFIVTKIIDAILTDDQLDECDLTLRELTQIRESMIRSLVAIYHSRVDYPGYIPPPSGQFRIESEGSESEAAAVKQAGSRETKEHAPATETIAAETPTPNKILYRNPADIPVSPGGEIEDEAIDRSKESSRSHKRSAP